MAIDKTFSRIHITKQKPLLWEDCTTELTTRYARVGPSVHVLPIPDAQLKDYFKKPKIADGGLDSVISHQGDEIPCYARDRNITLTSMDSPQWTIKFIWWLQ